MKITTRIVAIILVAVIMAASAAFAIPWLLTDHINNLSSSTPTLVIEVSGSNITSGSDLTSDWSWTGSAFTMTVTIYNTGGTVFQPTVGEFEPQNWPAGWSLSTNPPYGSTGLPLINPESSQAITITVTPPSTVAETSFTGKIAVSSSYPNNEWTSTQTFTIP